ncbi:hypothetical protein Trihar35433_6105 [Trichoderma harzianum]|nr:hypothetical protein Trihar35433_6105 [Trichoderma harzianum]
MANLETSSERSEAAEIMEGKQASAQPEHQVVLLKETVILRWLFGYLNKRNSSNRRMAPRWPHTISTWRPKKPKTQFRDVTLVGIDIDELKEQHGLPVQFHIGISILHTKDLHSLCHTSLPWTESQAKVIRSYHWVIQDPTYFSTKDNRFCFGKHKCIPLASLKENLEKLLEPHHPVILIAHGISTEKKLLQDLNIDLKPIFTIDTTKAAHYPLQDSRNYSLKLLLQVFGIPVTSGMLHVAGNDAHFVLRVLLMIAVSDVRREFKDTPAWVLVFEAIARAPLPQMPLTLHEKAVIGNRKAKGLEGLAEDRAQDQAR